MRTASATLWVPQSFHSHCHTTTALSRCFQTSERFAAKTFRRGLIRSSHTSERSVIRSLHTSERSVIRSLHTSERRENYRHSHTPHPDVCPWHTQAVRSCRRAHRKFAKDKALDLQTVIGINNGSQGCPQPAESADLHCDASMRGLRSTPASLCRVFKVTPTSYAARTDSYTA